MRGASPPLPVEFRSEHGEDLLIWDLLGGQSEGFFIEVGAFDGLERSVTYALEAVGWHGLLIEANPERCEQCRARRPNSTVVHAAVSRDGYAGTTTFVVLGAEDEIVSFMDQDSEHARRVAMAGTPKRRITVPLRTVDDILGGHQGPIDAAIIDVAGAELDVLHGFDIERWKPRLLFLNDQLGGDPGLTDYMATKPYVHASWLGANRLYVHQECADVLDRTAKLGDPT